MAVALIKNRIRFDTQLYGLASIVKESVVEAMRAYSYSPEQHVVYKIRKTELELQDLALNLNKLTGLVDSSLFDVTTQKQVAFENYALTNYATGGNLIVLQFEMDRNNNVTKRESYSILDLLSDICGINSILAVSTTDRGTAVQRLSFQALAL